MTTTCPYCSGDAWLDASGPGHSLAGYSDDEIRRNRRGFTEVRCDRCKGEGTIPCCEHHHECGVDEIGYCDACEEIAGKWSYSESDVIAVAAECVGGVA